MSSAIPIPSDAVVLQAAIAALADDGGPRTAYGVWCSTGELLQPVLRPTQTSISRFLEKAVATKAGRSPLVRRVPVKSVRASDGYVVTDKGRDALQTALEAPLLASVLDVRSVEAKVLLVGRYAAARHASQFIAAQLEQLRAPPSPAVLPQHQHKVFDPAMGSGSFLKEATRALLDQIARRRAAEREALIQFLEEAQQCLAGRV